MGIIGYFDTDIGITQAIEQRPSLVVDCANVADPHRFLYYTPPESFDDIYFIQVELIYAFRDALKKILPTATSYNAIIITRFKHLMNYQDKEENEEIYAHAWELITLLGRKTLVFVQLFDKEQERYCDTLWDTPLQVKEELSIV